MTFEEAIQGETFYTLDVVYGGIALKYTGMTADQRHLFIRWFNKYAAEKPNLVDIDLKHGILDREGLELAYNMYAHLSPLRFPRVISLCCVEVGTEVEYSTKSYLVHDLQFVVDKIMDDTFDNKIYMYNFIETNNLKLYMHLSKVNGRPNIQAIPWDWLMSSVDEHAAMLGMELKLQDLDTPVEYIQNEDLQPLLMKSSALRAQAVGKIMVSL